MSRQIAAATSLIVFAVCLLVGCFEARNDLTTILLRAMLAMTVTLVIGLLVGAMAERMLEENLKSVEEKNQNLSRSTPADDR